MPSWRQAWEDPMNRRLCAFALSLCVGQTAAAVENTSEIRQAGEGNEIRVEQIAGSAIGKNLSEILQAGSGNVITVKQEVATDSGDNDSQISQNGNGNSAIVEQRALTQSLGST